MESYAGFEKTTISNEMNQIDLDSDGIQIFQYSFKDGIHDHSINDLFYHSIFILSGTLNIENQVFSKGDFIIIDSEKKTDSLLETTTDVNSSFIFSSCSLSWTNCPEIIHIITGTSM